MKLQISFTKKGYPAFWEKGGGMSNSGHTELIGDKYGHKKKCMFVRTGGTLSNDNHGLFILNTGDIVLISHRQSGDVTHKIFRFTGEFDKISQTGEFEYVDSFDKGEWDNNFHIQIEDMISSAMEKIYKYHCRSVYYGLGIKPYDDIKYKLDKGELVDIPVGFLNLELLKKLLEVGKGLKALDYIKYDEEYKLPKECIGYILMHYGYKVAGKYMSTTQINDYLASVKRNTIDNPTSFILALHKPSINNEEFCCRLALSGVSVKELDTDDWELLPSKDRALIVANKRVYFIEVKNMPECAFPHSLGDVVFYNRVTLEATYDCCYVTENGKDEYEYNLNFYKSLEK